MQMKLQSDPTDDALLLLEKDTELCLQNCLLLEKSMLKQKSRDKRLNLGDFSYITAATVVATVSCLTCKKKTKKEKSFKP